METLWFGIVSFMIAVYVVLDGFDLGVGIGHRIIGRSEEERGKLIKSIGPFWDGNEVWLLAAGGTLYFAFPKLYASGFSGFYLPLIIVLWLLILRGIGIEFRHLITNPMWKSFWDSVFSLASILLVVFFGAALGNIIRGVPLNEEGYFFEPLWTGFRVVPDAGVLDWFTILMGLVALFTLATHGANYIAMRTELEIQSRARSVARITSWGLIATSILAFISAASIRPEILANYGDHPWGIIFPFLGVFSVIFMLVSIFKKKDTRAFISSCLFIISMLSATAFGLYPTLLPASTNPEYSITVYNAAAHEYGLSVGLVWWIPGFVLTSAYFVFLYRSFRGKVDGALKDVEY